MKIISQMPEDYTLYADRWFHIDHILLQATIFKADAVYYTYRSDSGLWPRQHVQSSLSDLIAGYWNQLSGSASGWLAMMRMIYIGL